MSGRARVLAGIPILLSLLLLPAGIPGARAQDGTPDLSGLWAGKVKYTLFPLLPAESGEKGKLPATLSIEQTGADLEIELTVEDEEGPQVVHLTGKVGNGSFWAYNGDPAEPFIVSGHVKGKAGKLKMKGKGILAGPTEAVEFRFSFKR